MVGARSPRSRLIAVVFPAPFGPSTATTSPASIRRSIPRSASTSAYDLRTLTISTTGVAAPLMTT